MKRSKKYKQHAKIVDASKEYALKEVVQLVKKTSYTKFSGTVELHINLNVKDKKKTQPVRGSIQFKHSIGKSIKIVVFSNDPAVIKKAKELGVVEAGSDELIQKIQKGWTDFDIAIAEPAMMPKIAILGKILGPKGAMPNPKNNTVTTDIEKAIKAYQAGKVDFKSDDSFVVHVSVGKVDMDEKALTENIQQAVAEVVKASGKSFNTIVKSIYIAPTMGPSIKLSKDEFRA